MAGTTTAYPGVLNGAYTYDFHNPFMSASIVTPTGNYALWTQASNNQTFNIDTLDPNLGNLKALSFLTELVVEMDVGYLPVITATLNPPLLDAIRLTETTLVEYGNTALEVVFGYASGATCFGQPAAVVTNPLSGVTALPDISWGTDATVVLKAHGVGAYGAYFTHGQTVYPPSMTTADIITEICLRNHCNPIFTNINADPTAEKVMNTPPISGGYAQGGRTDWSVIQDLLSLMRCFSVMSSTTSGSGGPPKGNLVIQPRVTFASQASALTLAFFSFPSGSVIGSTVFPILSMTTPTLAKWLPGVRAGIMQDVDTLKKKTLPPKVLVTSQQSGLSGTTPTGTGLSSPGAGDLADNDPNTTSPNVAKGVGLLPLPGAPDNPTAVQQGMSTMDTGQLAMAINLEVETMGCPTIFPGMVVTVSGCGLRLNGNYGVWKVTHTLGVSGYMTRLLLIQNTASILAQKFAAPNLGPVGTGMPGTADNTNSTTVQPQQQ